MNYLTIAEGQALRGLRLVLSAHVPGPWGESAKAAFAARQVDFAAVAQTPLEANDELRRWTGVRNAPVAVLDSEPPVTGWLEIVMLAERLGSGPSLLPAGSRDRALCFGFSNEICGPRGLGWERRLMIFAKVYGDAPLAPDAPTHLHEMRRQYGFTKETADAAPARIVNILDALADQLRRQQTAGSEYLVGDELSAADLHWACFSAMLAPLPQAVNPMPDYLRPLYEDIGPHVAAAVDPLLIAHRNRIYQRHIGLPLDY
jgi:glutathione S-transferase